MQYLYRHRLILRHELELLLYPSWDMSYNIIYVSLILSPAQNVRSETLLRRVAGNWLLVYAYCSIDKL